MIVVNSPSEYQDTSLISVIIPCYNASRFLNAAVASIVNQTYKNLEILLINDGSSDNTLSIIEHWHEKDERIKVVNNTVNLKLIKTLNKGISLSSGSYIARMDADDIALPDRLEKQLKYMQDNPAVDIISTYCKYINADDSIHSINTHFCCSTHSALSFMAIFESPLLHPGVFAKSALFKENLYADKPSAAHVEDYELWCRLLNKGFRLGAITEYALLYRRNPESVSFKNRELQSANHIYCSSQQLLHTLPEETVDQEIFETILTRQKKYNRKNLKKAIITLDMLCGKYIEKYQTGRLSKEYAEIKNWVTQRKIRMLVLHFLNGNTPLRLYVAVHFVTNMAQYFTSNALKGFVNTYIKRHNNREL